MQRKSKAGLSLTFKKNSAYCKSDVQLLKEACLTFAHEMKALTGVNPLIQAVMIASNALLVWSKNHLEPDLVALAPRNGWRKHQVNQSQEAIEWLEYEGSKVGGMGRI